MPAHLTVWSTPTPDGHTHQPYIVCLCGHRSDYPYDVRAGQFGPWSCPACGATHALSTCRKAYKRCSRDRNLPGSARGRGK